MKTKSKALDAGVRMAAVAAAGSYFVYGRHAAGDRERIKGWALQLKGDVLQEMEKLAELNQRTYHDLVDKTTRRYGRLKNVSVHELKHITLELKNAWTHIGMTLL